MTASYKRRPVGTSCSGCGQPRDRDGQRYCRACHAEANRRHRAKIRAELLELRALVQRGTSGVTHETREAA